jgi:GT2 family glycosyltransferase
MSDHTRSSSGELVSVCIVTRNRKEDLGRAIKSVYDQPYRPVEIVVVDNDSTDGTVEYVIDNWPDVRLIRLHRNIGCQPARNIAMKNCRGKFIFSLDDDAVLDEQCINETVARMQELPNVALLAARVVTTNPDELKNWRQWDQRASRFVSNFPGCAFCIRSEVLSQVGYFPEYVRGHAEADLSLRILDAGWDMIVHPPAVVYHAVSPVERNSQQIQYYLTLHRLETLLRLAPFPYCIPELIFRLISEFFIALRSRTLKGYIHGVVRFIYDLPISLRRRRPVSKLAMRKQWFLAERHITDSGEIAQAERYSYRKRLMGRLRRSGRQGSTHSE